VSAEDAFSASRWKLALMHAKLNIAGRLSPPSRQMMLCVVALTFAAVSALALDSKRSYANPTGTKLADGITSSSAASAVGRNTNEGLADPLTLFGARTKVAAAAANIGLHDIVQGSVTPSSNDAFDFFDSNLMRAAATLTYAADSAARAYDEANTLLAARANGYKPAQTGRRSKLLLKNRRCFPAHHAGRASSYYVVGDAMWSLAGAPIDFSLIRSAADPAGR
jgi:hypothetical protein